MIGSDTFRYQNMGPQCFFHHSHSKKLGAVEFKDFRTISLITGFYKIMAKVLANRLEKMLD